MDHFLHNPALHPAARHVRHLSEWIFCRGGGLATLPAPAQDLLRGGYNFARWARRRRRSGAAAAPQPRPPPQSALARPFRAPRTLRAARGLPCGACSCARGARQTRARRDAAPGARAGPYGRHPALHPAARHVRHLSEWIFGRGARWTRCLCPRKICSEAGPTLLAGRAGAGAAARRQRARPARRPSARPRAHQAPPRTMSEARGLACAVSQCARE